MNLSRFSSHDGREIQLYVWDNVKKPKAVVKIAHGMAEHSARYADFAEYLNAHGYIVVMNDHRGHGLTAEKNSLGYEQGDMWLNNVKDQLAILDYCRDKWNLPLFMMGHSYGSFITQAVIEEHPSVAGFILCGSNYMKGISFSLCRVIAKGMCKHKGGRHPAELIVKLSFKMYEKKFPGENAWLNRDEAEVKKYNDDPMNGFTCSANFYRTFMNGIKQLYKSDYYSQIDIDEPLLIISGGDDPVGSYGKGVSKLDNFYRNKVGVKDVTMHLYENARHEILNEQCKQQVYDDVLQWLDSKVAR
ncbi:MAG: lysophospholipase [Clostridiales bacterium]|nr:lysophospholipase [Clostridiales bacterium]